MVADLSSVPLTGGRPAPLRTVDVLKSHVTRKWIALLCLCLIIVDLLFLGNITQWLFGPSRSGERTEHAEHAEQIKHTPSASMPAALASDKLVPPQTSNLVAIKPSVPPALQPDDLTPAANARIAIVTFFTREEGSQALKAITFPNFQTYARRHGYTVLDAMDDPEIASLFEEHMKHHSVTHFFKFVVMAKLLPRFDWLMWADGDSIFLNMGRPLTDLLDPAFDAVFTINPKDEPTWSLIVNAGHYILRNAPWTTSFLQEALYMSEHDCHDFLGLVPDRKVPVLNGWITLCGEDGGYWLSDQGILQWLIMYKPQEFRCHMQFRGFRDFNSEFPWYEDGDFVLHFPGRSGSERKKLIPMFLERTDPNTGIVDRNGTTLLDPVPNKANARDMYVQHYAPMNVPCPVWKLMVKPKELPKSSA